MTSSNRSVNKDIRWRSTEQAIWCHVAWNKLWGAWKVQSHKREGRWDRGSDASCFSPEIFSTWNIFTWYIFPPGIFFALNFVETFFSGSLRIGGQLCFFQKDKCNISVSVFDLIPNKDDDMRLTIQKTKRRKRRAGTTILDFKCLRFPAMGMIVTSCMLYVDNVLRKGFSLSVEKRFKSCGSE